jgi:hypothetical protein
MRTPLYFFESITTFLVVSLHESDHDVDAKDYAWEGVQKDG